MMAVRSDEYPRCHGSAPQPVQGLAAMAAERRPRKRRSGRGRGACVGGQARRPVRVHRHRLGFEDLEDCFSQATLELVMRARTRARAFQNSEGHIANALEQRFLSRISDRRRALSGRSPIEAATQAALRRPDDQDGGPEGSSLASIPDPAADVAGRIAGRDDVGRLRELADELTADQRLVLACRWRSTWSARSSVRASAGRRDSPQGCAARPRAPASWSPTTRRESAARGLADDLTAYVANVAGRNQSACAAT